MPLTTLTVDFWNTLYDATNGPPRRAARMDAFIGAARAAGYACTADDYDTVHRGLWAYFDHHWLEKQRTPTSHEMVREMLRQMEFKLEDHVVDRVAKIFEEGVLDHPPALLPGARQTLAELHERGVMLALISDTSFSPGRVLRQLMQRDDVARYFGAFIFSDETGVAKPHPEAFGAALARLDADRARSAHIGDIERTDIRGARAAGMRAILYRGCEIDHKYAEESTDADVIVDHWNEVLEVVTNDDRWSRGGTHL